MNVDIGAMHRALEAALEACGGTLTITIDAEPISLRQFHEAVEQRLVALETRTDELTSLCAQGLSHEQRLDAERTHLRAELQHAQATIRARRKKTKTIDLRRDARGAVTSYEVFESV